MLSLRKRVVFEGNYIVPAGQEAREGKNTKPAAPPAKDAQKKEQTEEQTQAPARIVGTAKISGESPIDVDAVAMPQ